MELPANLILSSLEEGKIYFFKDNPPTGISKHLHVCIKKNEEKTIFFTCCTSQENTMSRLIKYQGLNPETIVRIKKDFLNHLDADDTFVNCNNVYMCTFDEFCSGINDGRISSSIGEMSKAHYFKIINGILKSDLVPIEIQDIIRHEKAGE
jgi:predicted metal-binding transcription factor (methanogenesis marker protein 9)